MNVSYSVPRLPEEIFQLSHLPPTAHSKFIRVEYELNGNLKYNVSWGGYPNNKEALPNISIPLTIVSVMDRAVHGLVEPDDFNP